MNGRKYPRNFERITKDGGLRRMQVPGGWLVHSSTEYIRHAQNGSCSEALIFFPDPDFMWVLEEGNVN